MNVPTAIGSHGFDTGVEVPLEVLRNADSTPNWAV